MDGLRCAVDGSVWVVVGCVPGVVGVVVAAWNNASVGQVGLVGGAATRWEELGRPGRRTRQSRGLVSERGSSRGEQLHRTRRGCSAAEGALPRTGRTVPAHGEEQAQRSSAHLARHSAPHPLHGAAARSIAQQQRSMAVQCSLVCTQHRCGEAAQAVTLRCALSTSAYTDSARLAGAAASAWAAAVTEGGGVGRGRRCVQQQRKRGGRGMLLRCVSVCGLCCCSARLSSAQLSSAQLSSTASGSLSSVQLCRSAVHICGSLRRVPRPSSRALACACLPVSVMHEHIHHPQLSPLCLPLLRLSASSFLPVCLSLCRSACCRSVLGLLSSDERR